jgi:2,3-bisphosphoglycerate-independent phosphoglycerate mutase
MNTMRQVEGSFHVMGLCSDGGVHAHSDHLIATANLLAETGKKIFLHLFTDGRDTPPSSALEYVTQVINNCQHSNIEIASICGRYFAMDRDKRWERVEKAYQAIASANAPRFASPLAAITASYQAGKTDEFIEPTIGQNYQGMKDGDGLFMVNFRADRARELLEALLLPNFSGFSRQKKINFATTAGMTEYAENLTPFMPALFPQEIPQQTLGEVIAKQNMKQLRIAETEKYAHVTFFLNGGLETVFSGEERILVPSPNVATYDSAPSMSAQEVTQKLVDAIQAKTYQLIVVNFANGDMVGHTGSFPAAVKAVEALDVALGQLEQATKAAGMAMLITADHGNCEEMYDVANNTEHTQHTTNTVPFIAIHVDHGTKVHSGGLSDIAPTVLHIMGIEQPKEMTGRSLLY